MNDAARCRALLPNNVISKSFVTETVLMDVNCGRYFKLDRAAGAMLDALIAQPSIAAAAAVLAGQGWGSEEVLLTDLDALCADLSALGLVRLQTD
jgi:Coenzyme PQQ synthesis protein D (PqqD)